MARTTYVKKAQKPQGKCYRGGCGKAIKEGDSYYWFANRIGRSSIRKVFCSEHAPRPSEKTTSDKLSQIYAAQEALEDAVSSASSLEDLCSALREAAEQGNEVAEAYRESISNMPESLQSGSTADEMEEKASQCEEWAQTCEGAADEIEGMYDDSETPEDDDVCNDCGHQFSDHHLGGACTATDTADGKEVPCDCEGFERSEETLEEARTTADNACGELSL